MKSKCKRKKSYRLLVNCMLHRIDVNCGVCIWSSRKLKFKNNFPFGMNAGKEIAICIESVFFLISIAIYELRVSHEFEGGK